MALGVANFRLSGVYLGTPRESGVITVPQASVQALGTTEYEIVPAVADAILVPKWVIVKKLSGAYTVSGVTMLTMCHGTVSDNIPCTPWGNSPAFSLLVDANEVVNVIPAPVFGNGFSAGLPFGPFNATLVVAKKLALRTTGSSSPAGAGGDLRVKVWYDEIPFSILDLE